MLELRPFEGDVVRAERAARVVAPPYDALAPEARAALAATDPDSYLGALPPGGTAGDGDAYDVALVACRDHLDRLRSEGRYRCLEAPAIGVLRFGAGPHAATAVVGDVPVGAFASGDVLPHEQVRDGRVHELARYLEVVGVASSPVALTQRPDAAVSAATDEVTRTVPTVAYRAEDGVDVALWCVTDPGLRERLCTAVAGAGIAYLADGHHRAAAAARYAGSTGAGPDDPAGRVLCAVLPSDQLTVHPFHRRLEGAPDPVPALAALARDGIEVRDAAGPAAPAAPRIVLLTAGGRWWHLDVSGSARTDDVVESLDVRLVERDLIPRLAAGRDVEVVPVAAPLGLDALVAPGAVGLALHPPSIEAVLAVAEAGRTLPPKTTYVTPKLRSGLVVTPRPRPATATSP